MKIKWLHFSDLNFSNMSCDIDSVKVALLACLSELRKESEFNYVFITGDMTGKNDYASAKTYVKRLLDCVGVAFCNVFWAAGNQDIKHSKMRNSIINEIHKPSPPPRIFETIMADEDKRDLLTNISMSDYIREYEQLFNRKLSSDEISNAHVSYSLEHCNIVVLNTCLISRDDNDEHNLMIMEPKLFPIFDKLDKNKPLIVLGHHSSDFFNKAEQDKLSTLFDRAGVDIYLCGHAPHLGCSWFNNTNPNTLQITCSNTAFEDNSPVFSFMIGEYDTDTLTLQVTPYSYSKHNKTFHKNNNILSCLPQNNIFLLTRLKNLPSEKTEHPLEYIYLFDRLQGYYTLLNKRFSLSDVDKKLFPKVRGRTDEKIYDSIPILCNSLVSSSMERTLLIVGEGGTGKTTALLDFWQTLLENKCALPLYVPLNEYTAESNFIQEYIKTNYEQIDIDTLKYNFVLLLDGFNEMPHKNPLPLMQEIANWLNKKSSNINVIITSRDEFTTDYLIKFQQYDVQPLDINVVKNYLDSDSSTVNELYSPMMLDLYKNTDKQKKQAKKKRVPINFKDGLKRGEILYNYLLGQIVNCVIQGQIDQIVPVWYTLFEVAPYIAYDMEASNIYYIKKAILEQKISTFCKQFPVENQIKKCSEWLQNLIKNKKRYQLKVSDDEVQKILLVDNKYLFRKDENEQYIFRHQHFRDFLSALHIANVIRNSLINDVNLSLEGSNDHDLMDWPVSDTEYIYLSPEVYNRKWPDHICEMLGDYYGDYKHRTKYDKQYRTELHDLLDRLRGLQRVESSYAVRNIINTWRKARDNRIIDENLALLDLSQTSLNGVILADKQFFTKFDGSIISESTLLSNGHFGAVRSAVYSADGSRILSASYDCTVKEWDRETENCIHTFTGHTQRVRSAVYSRDGKRILSASYDCTVKEWDRETENCIHTFTGHTDIVQDVVYSADGSRILSASYDGTVKEWDRETEICIHTFKIDSASDRVNSVRYSLDGTCILATNRKGTIEEWLIKNVTLRHTYAVNGHKQNTCSAVYSRDGKRILSASYDGTVKEWDRETENCIHTYPDQMDSGEWSAEVRSAVYGGKNDEYILSASHDGTVKEWNRTTEKCVCTFKGHDHWVRSAVYSDDWKYVLSASEDGTIKEWDRETQICLRTFKGSPNWVRNVVLSDDGCRVLTAFDRNIVEWDKKKGVYLQIFSGHSDFVRSAVYGGKNDEYILSASHDGTVKEWNRTTGEPTDIINVYPDRVNIAVYNKDRTRILFALCNGTIKEYDIQTKEILHTFTGHNKEVCSMMYSKNELYILSASEDGTVREWNRETAIESLQYTHGSSVYSVRYSYDTFYILSAANDHTIKEYNKKNCTSKVFGDSACQEKHDSRVYSVVYSKDDKYILSASYDGTVKEWDRETGNCIHTFEGLNNGVRTATYSSDKCICAISNNGVIMEWNRENTKSPLCKKQLFGLFIKNCSFKGCSFVSEEINRLVQLYSGNVQNAFLRSIVAKKLRGKPREIHIALDTDDGKPKNLILTGSNGCGKTSMLIELKQAVEDIIAGKVNNEFVANFSDSDSEVIQVLRLEHKMRYYKCVFISAVHNNHWSSMGDDISLDFWEKLKDIQVNIYRCTSNNSIERKFWIELLKKIENILQGLFVNKTIKLNYDTKNNDFRMYYTFGNSSENVGMLQRHQLPDGYSAVLNIFWAIVKPWKDMTIPFKRIRGLVIIDELEAHLHVQMQKDILPYLMKLFPEVQFIVATHSPYILNSAENVVIYDMEKEEIIKKSDELYELSGLSIDEITKTLLGCDKYSKAVRTLLKKYDKDCDNKYVKGAYETYDKLDSILSDTNPLKWALRKRRKWLKGADYEEVK